MAQVAYCCVSGDKLESIFVVFDGPVPFDIDSNVSEVHFEKIRKLANLFPDPLHIHSGHIEVNSSRGTENPRALIFVLGSHVSDSKEVKSG